MFDHQTGVGCNDQLDWILSRNHHHPHHRHHSQLSSIQQKEQDLPHLHPHNHYSSLFQLGPKQSRETIDSFRSSSTASDETGRQRTVSEDEEGSRNIDPSFNRCLSSRFQQIMPRVVPDQHHTFTNSQFFIELSRLSEVKYTSLPHAPEPERKERFIQEITHEGRLPITFIANGFNLELHVNPHEGIHLPIPITAVVDSSSRETGGSGVGLVNTCSSTSSSTTMLATATGNSSGTTRSIRSERSSSSSSATTTTTTVSATTTTSTTTTTTPPHHFLHSTSSSTTQHHTQLHHPFHHPHHHQFPHHHRVTHNPFSPLPSPHHPYHHPHHPIRPHPHSQPSSTINTTSNQYHSINYQILNGHSQEEDARLQAEMEFLSDGLARQLEAIYAIQTPPQVSQVIRRTESES